MATTIQLRRDTAAQWTSVNPLLADGEVGIEKDTRQVKIGNGTDHWTALPYFTDAALGAVVSNLISAHNALSNAVSVGGMGGSASPTSAQFSVLSANVQGVSNATSNEASVRAAKDNLLSAAIQVVSNAVSVESSARAAADDALSNHISTVSVHIDLVSNAASNALSVANAASANLVVVSNAISNETSARQSASAALETHAAAASAAATSAVTLANAADAHANTASAAATSAVALANAADAHANTASAAATSADAHAAAASAAATSVDAHVNTVSGAVEVVSARVVSVSAEVTSLLASASATLEAHINVVSNATSNEISARQSASAALETHINTASARIASVSAELASLVQIASAAATSVDAHADAISARAASISAELGSLINIVSNATSNEASVRASADSNLSARINSVGGLVGGSASPTSAQFSALSASVKAVSDAVSDELSARQSASAALETHINTVSARGASISAELGSLVQVASAAVTSVDARVTSVNAGLASVSARVVAGTSVKGLQSVANALSNRASAALSLASIGNLRATFAIQLLHLAPHQMRYDYSGTTTMADPGLQNFRLNNATLSSATQMAIYYTDGWSTNQSDMIKMWDDLAAFTARGVIYIVDQTDSGRAWVKYRITGALTDNTTWAQVPITYESAGSVALTASATMWIIFFPADPNLSDVGSAINVASAAATSADAHANTVSARAASISAEVVSLANSADAALSVRIDTVSNADSVTRSAYANASTVGSIAALSIVSAQLGNGQFHVVGNGQTLSTGTFTKVSGLSLSLGQNNVYQVQGQVNYNGVGAASTTAIFQLGMSATNQPVYAALRFMGAFAGQGASSNVSAFQFGGESAICATPSVMFSVRPGVSAQAYAVFFDGIIQGNAGAGAVLKVVAATTTTANGGCTIRGGSYIKAVRIA